MSGIVKSTFMLLISSMLFGCISPEEISEEIQLSQFVDHSGFPEVDVPWPEWVLEHWVWEDESTQQSAINLVEDYLDHDIPVGAVIIDSPWETGYNTCEFDRDLYEDAQAMIDHFHDLDVRLLLWITGVVNVDEEELYAYGAEHNYFMQTLPNCGPAIINWWKGDGSLIDFFNPEAVDWWKSIVDKALDLGIDGWKCDGTDFFSILTPWSPGANCFVSRRDYSYSYYQFMHDYTRERLGDDRVNMVRPIDNYGVLEAGGDFLSFAPVEITWAGWVGDQDATFNGMKKALNNMFYSSRYGYLLFGSDIGGYREDDQFPQGRSKELFIRWAQLGALCPLMENGGGGDHRPWMFDEETTDIYRRFTELHYALIPYLMFEGEQAWSRGGSLMEFFNKHTYSYMLGEDVFVAPITGPDQDFRINFPVDGDWVYLFDRSVIHEGGSTGIFNFVLEEFPVYLRQGSTIELELDFE